MRITRPSTGDLVAGLSVALVAIPQSLAYARLAGMPAQFGLYATALPALLAAPFVSSRYLQTGPVALTALLTFGALAPLAPTESAEYISLAALLALLVGLFRLFFGLVRLGQVAYLLSEPVLTGFTTGAAIVIISSQLPRIFDLDPEGGVLRRALSAATDVGQWRWSAIAFAAGTAIAIVGGRRIHRLFPVVLVAVVVGVIVSTATGYSGATVGELDGSFVSLSLDLPWSSIGRLLVPALAIALVGFAEPASIARTFAAEEREPWDANREMVSQGVANVAAAASGAFPVGGSFSRSSLNKLAGATSPWSGAVTGLLVLAALPLTPLLEDLPGAILGAIVLVAVLNLIRVRDLVRLFSQSLPQALVGVGTLAATLIFTPEVQWGVLVGIGLALTVHLYRELSVTVEGRIDGRALTVAPKGVLWFASVPQIDRLIRAQIAEHHELDRVIVDLAGVGRIDFSGGAALARIVADLTTSGVAVGIVNVPPGTLGALSQLVATDADVTPMPPVGRRPGRGPGSRPSR
ncbi:MAG: SulP family inorganic anion transporter [Actinomycetota bacterium]